MIQLTVEYEGMQENVDMLFTERLETALFEEDDDLFDINSPD